jgi:hypothetical protein
VGIVLRSAAPVVASDSDVASPADGSGDPARPAPSDRAAGRRRWLTLAVVATLVGLVHAALIAPHYHVGSFDDDAGYVAVARALASGVGLTGRLSSGHYLIEAAPPGYPALLVPIAFFAGMATLAYRALSVAMFVALFPLTWIYLGRRGLSDPARLAVLVLLALNPVAATYATMVMAEMPFLVGLMVLLLLADRWRTQARTWTWAGVGVMVLAAGLLWTKEAAVGLFAGLVLWLVVRGAWRKAGAFTVVVVVANAPLLIARAVIGIPLVGSRYSGDFAGYSQGGLVNRLVHVVPHGAWTMLSVAIPQSILPVGSPLPTSGPFAFVLNTANAAVAVLVVIGAVAWFRRHDHAAAVMVAVYLAETITYPFVNERRVILVLPIVLAWAVCGAAVVAHWVVQTAHAAGADASRPAVLGVDALRVGAALIVVGPLLVQLPRDYLLGLGQDTSAPQGSPYMTLLRRIGSPTDVVETDYVWTTGLFTGHRTANAAYVAPCPGPPIAPTLAQDGAAFFLSGALNRPGVLGNDCVLDSVVDQPGAVRLLRTSTDLASVFELTGPGTVHPDLTDLASADRVTSSVPGLVQVPEEPQALFESAGNYLVAPLAQGQVALTWTWGRSLPVTQVSLGAATVSAGAARGVSVALLESDGVWHDVAGSAGGVGEHQSSPFLLATPTPRVLATAARVSVRGDGQGSAAVHDFHVLASNG